jgi:hypothetical protein
MGYARTTNVIHDDPLACALTSMYERRRSYVITVWAPEVASISLDTRVWPAPASLSGYLVP